MRKNKSGFESSIVLCYNKCVYPIKKRHMFWVCVLFCFLVFCFLGYLRVLVIHPPTGGK